MSWDQYNNWINDGRTGYYDPRLDPRDPRYDFHYAQAVARAQGVPPGYSNYGQPPQTPMQPAAPQSGSGMTVTPEMVHVDIIRIYGEQDVIDAIVPADGEPRMYMTPNESLIATKQMTANGPKIRFYYPQDYQPEPKLDTKNVVLRSELEPLVSQYVDARWAQIAPSAAQMAQAGSGMAYDTPETPVQRSAPRSAKKEG